MILQGFSSYSTTLQVYAPRIPGIYLVLFAGDLTSLSKTFESIHSLFTAR